MQAALSGVERAAAAHRLRVDDDGAVRDTSCLPTPPDPALAAAARRDRERARQAAQAAVREVLRSAGDIDDDLAAVLVRAATDDVDSGGATSLDQAWRVGAGRTTITIPAPPAGGPYAAATWWRALTAEQRSRAAVTMPATLGALDGLPAGVRDAANRTVMAQERTRLERLLPGLHAAVARARAESTGGDDQADVARVLRIRSAQDGLHRSHDRAGRDRRPRRDARPARAEARAALLRCARTPGHGGGRGGRRRHRRARRRLRPRADQPGAGPGDVRHVRRPDGPARARPPAGCWLRRPPAPVQTRWPR